VRRATWGLGWAGLGCGGLGLATPLCMSLWRARPRVAGGCLCRAINRVRAKVKGFTLDSWEKWAGGEVEQFFKLHASRDYSAMKGLLTDQYFTAVRRGLEDAVTKRHQVESMKVLQVLEAAKVRLGRRGVAGARLKFALVCCSQRLATFTTAVVGLTVLCSPAPFPVGGARAVSNQMVHARLVYLTPVASRGMFQTPDFAQLTVRTVTVQTPLILPLPSRKGSKLGMGGGQGAGAADGPNALDWRAAVAPSGFVYYYNSLGQVQWTRPPSFGTVGVGAVTVDDLGSVLETLETDAAGLPTKLRVVNYRWASRLCACVSGRGGGGC
jgi:hypothetical protein